MWCHGASSVTLLSVWLQEGWVGGSLKVCSNMLMMVITSSLQISSPVPLVARCNGLGRTQRNQSAGCLTVRVPQAQPGPDNNNKGKRNKQEEQNPEADPMQMLTHVLKLLQILSLDPNVKDQLQNSLQGHVVRVLQPQKSTVELIVEKQTQRAREGAAFNPKQVKHDQLMTSAQIFATEIGVHSERLACLDAELLFPPDEIRLQELQQQPPRAPAFFAPLTVQMPLGALADLPEAPQGQIILEEVLMKRSESVLLRTTMMLKTWYLFSRKICCCSCWIVVSGRWTKTILAQAICTRTLCVCEHTVRCLVCWLCVCSCRDHRRLSFSLCWCGFGRIRFRKISG